MLRTHKGMSIIMALCLCIALLAPVFVVTPADAATVSASNVPTVAKAAGQNLGSVIIDFGILNAGLHSGVIKLPTSFVIADDGDGTAVENLRVSNLCGGLAPAFVAAAGVPAAGQYRLIALSANQLQFDINVAAVARDVKFGIVLTNVTVPSSADATINASVIKLDGDFTDGLVAVGKTSVGSVDILRTDPPTVSAGNPSIMVAPATSIFQIHVREDVAGAVAQGTETLKFKLPKGVTWAAGPTVMLFPGNVALPAGEVFTCDVTDSSILKIQRTTAGGVPAAKYTFTINAQVNIDADSAAFGDIEAIISGRTTSNNSSIKIATYQDFGYTVKAEKPETEVVAGLQAQTISNVTIKENIANSLIAGRTITAKLNDGAKWNANFAGIAKAGGFALNFTRSATDFSKATATIPALAGKGECALEKVEIDVAADYAGPIEIQFSGNAGINDKITVAKALAPISATADSKDIIIGVQNQAAGKITISESKAETVKSRTLVGAAADLVLSAPYGVTWAKAPTVKVVEGDLSLNVPTTGFAVVGGKHQVTIPVKSVSSKASKIEISDIVYNVDRTVPEGDLKVEIGGSALDQTSVLLNPTWVNRDVVATVVAAKVITPAPTEGTVGAVAGQFKLGSNIYQVNGVSKIMDAAPYVKDSRTYVPIRYLGYALGLTDADIVWDAAAQKATLTLGDKKVELTIGSTTITVNGEAKTMDVAPEITNDRTMLPARFVAEGLGFQVGWDAGTGTVLVSK
ncbi:copper amine oxidase N-terminal domain-containing protein [Syntrophomonas palmitatica]|uniref:copper amine oxidase N-terminal domain-containing protein n=1 Tax=Syntrophomonas palmitatica TaxID=402877 RepID=UPI0006D1B4AC|nr:copper amine oxidase N-terminal domain-containing protein [Syntrophomonas palmitatica]